MNKFDIRIETVLDGIMAKANQTGIELICESMYNDGEPRSENAVFVQNAQTERFGLICLNLENKDPDEMQFLTFDPKLYQYSKSEGFTKEEGFQAFGTKILKNVSLKEFLKFITSEQTY
tara:strand:+ start:874 stop:1230 length:357 start_codon:yes stop_codon:yes gene_type:complete